MPKAYKSCVRQVGHKKGARSAHAICTAANAGNIKAARKREAAARRRARR